MEELLEALLRAKKNGDIEIPHGGLFEKGKKVGIKIYPVHRVIVEALVEWGYEDSMSAAWRKALEEAFVREAAKREVEDVKT